MDMHKLKVLLRAVDKEVEAIFEKHGFKWEGRKATNDEHTGVLKYNVTLSDANITGKDGTPTNPYAIRWDAYHNIFGLPADGVGKTFRSPKGRLFTIVGLRDARSEKIVVAECNGRNYIFTPDEVKRLLKQHEEAA